MKNTIPVKPLLKCMALLAWLAAGTASAQTFYTPFDRGQAGTESAYWNSSFTNNTGGPNYTGIFAPGGSALANASITSLGASTILTGGHIYGYPSVNSFELNYSGSSLTPVGSVVFQAYSLGTDWDYSSVLLSYTTGSGSVSLAPEGTVVTYAGSGMSASELAVWSWNLPLPDDVSDFTITFGASGQHNSFSSAMLDVSPFNVAAVPEPGTLAMAGMGGLGLLLLGQRLRRQVAG